MPHFKRKKGKRITNGQQSSAVENENTATEEDLLKPMLMDSGMFQDRILPALQNAYMYTESGNCFRYGNAQLINSGRLQEGYQAFRVEKKKRGYNEQELEESFGFLLFNQEEKAKKLCESGLLVGHSTCYTLGDPSKGVYISKYSDCLDFSPWYHGMSGYIAILRLTKGRVKAVRENYTPKFTAPSHGFDCHVSEQISAVSSTTSSFLAYERTQYYLYEPCGPGEGTTAYPRHALPFAIVAFSYGETTPCTPVSQEKRSAEKAVFHYHPWRGQLHIQSLVYHVALRSNTGALTPVQLPATLTVERAMKITDLMKHLPQGIFETCFTSEVSLEGRFCSLYEVVPSAAKDALLPLLTLQLKEKELALVLQLNDSGLLILLHSSHFLIHEDPLSEMTERLLAMFVFPDSRALQKETKMLRSSLSPEVLQVLPGLNYAEAEALKCPPNQQGALCDLMEQRLQSYAALIQPGVPDSPSALPDQYDVPKMLNHLYRAPKCREVALQRLQSYLAQPKTYILPVARAIELLAVGQEERGDDADDDVYYCLSSPEAFSPTLASFYGDRAGVEGETGPEGGAEGITCQQQEGESEAATTVKVSQSSVPEDLGTPATVAMTCATTPMSGNLPADHIITGSGEVSAPGPMAKHITHLSGSEKSAYNAVIAESSEKTGDSLFETGHLAGGKISRKPGVKPPTSRRRNSRQGRKRKKVSHSVQRKGLGRDGQSVYHRDIEELQPPKRKGFGYGLRTIITDCGMILVPHGTEILPKEIASWTEMRRAVNSQCAEEKVAEPAGVPSRHIERTDKQAKPMDTADIQTPPIETPDQQAPPIETADRQTPPIETTDQQAPPIETADRQAPPMDTANIQTPPIETGDRQAPPQKTADRPAPPMDTADIQTPPIKTADRQAPPIETGDRQAPPKETADIQTPPMDTADIEETAVSLRIPAGPMVLPHTERDQRKDNVSKMPPDEISLEGKQRSKALISFKEFRTIVQTLKRRNLGRSDGQTLAVFVTDLGNSEPLQKKSKSDSVTANAPQNANASCANPEREGTRQRKNIPRRLDLHKPSLHPDHLIRLLKSQVVTSSVVEQVKLKPFKKQLRSRLTVATEENGWLNSDTAGPRDSEKIGQLQSWGLRSDGHRVGSGGTSHFSDSGPTGACQPADALTLLADLALSASGNETLQNFGLTTSFLAREQRRPAQCELPLRSPPPQALVVSEEAALVISKEHSYSLPSPCCMLLGLTGGPHQLSPQNVVETSLPDQPEPPNITDKDGITPVCQEMRSKQEVANQPSPCNLPAWHPVAEEHTWGSSWTRRVVQVGEAIHVTRLWKDTYDFNHDSKYTSDPLDKSVLRALHGPWDFAIEETFEQAHLILHMWIGLFYSKSTTRFFPSDPNGPVLLARPPAAEARGDSQVMGAASAASPSSDARGHAYEMQPCTPPPPPLEQEVLDLREESKKATEPLLPCFGVLNLSPKRPEALDLSVDSENREACAHKSAQKSPAKTPVTPVQQPTPRQYNCSSTYNPCPYTYSQFVHEDHRAIVDIVSDEASEQGDDCSSSRHEDDVDDGCDPGCPGTGNPLKNDAAYTQLCEHTASVFISKEKVFNGTHRGATLVKDGNMLFNCTLQLIDRERDLRTCRRKERTPYIHPCRLTNIGHRATEALQPVAGTHHESIKGIIDKEVHVSYGEERTPVHDGNGYSKIEESTEWNYFRKDEEDASLHSENHFDKAEEHTTLHDGNDFSKDEEHTVLQDVNDEHTAVYDRNDSSKGVEHTAMHDGNDFNKEEHAAVYDGSDSSKGVEHTAMHDGSDSSEDEEHTAVHYGNDSSEGEEQAAVHDGNDSSEDKKHTALHDGNDSNEDEHTAVHDELDSSEDEEHAMFDGNDSSEDEEHTAVHDGNDSSKGEEHTAVHDGNDSSKGKEHTAVHDGNEFRKDEHTTYDGNDSSEDKHAMYDGNDFSEDEEYTMYDGNYSSKGEEHTAVHDGNDSSEGEEHTAVHDGNDSSDDEEHTAVRDGNDFRKDEHRTYDGNGSIEGEEHTAVHDGNDSSEDEEQTAMDDGNYSSEDEEHTAVHDGNDEPSEMHDGNDSSEDEEHTAVDNGNFRKDEEYTAVHDGNDENPEMHNGNDSSEDEEHTAVHDGNDEPPEMHDGNGSSEDEERTAVHDGKDFSKDEHATYDGNDSSEDEEQTAMDDGNYFSKDEECTAVHDRNNEPPKMHDGNDSSENTEHTAVHDGNDSSEDEEYTAVDDGNDFSKDVESTAVHDGNDENPEMHDGNDSSEGEEQAAVHDGNDSSEDKKHTALHDGNDSCEDEDHTAVHDEIDFSKEEHATYDGNDSSEGEEQAAVHDGNDSSEDKKHTALHDGNDSSEDEHTTVHDGNDFSEDEEHAAVDDGNDFSGEEEHTAVHDGNDSSEDEEHTAVHEGNDSSEDEEHTAVHDGNDSSEDEEHTAVDDGNFSKDEESTAVNDEHPEMHDMNDSSEDEEHTAVHDGNDFSEDEEHTTYDGNDSSEDEHTAVHDGNDSSEDEEHTAVHDGNDSSEGEEHTAVHDGNDSSEDEEHTAVHDGNDSSEDEEHTAVDHGNDFSKDEECTAVHDGNDEHPAMHDGNYLIKGEQQTAVCNFNEMHDTSVGQEERPTAMLGGSYAVSGEIQTSLFDKNDSSKVFDLEKSIIENRSPTPTQDELPYDHNLRLNKIRTAVPDACSLNSEESTSRSPTPTQDELPCDHEPYSYNSCFQVELVGSDREIVSAVYLLQSGNEPCPSRMQKSTQGSVYTLEKPFSCTSPTSDHILQNSHEAHPNCKNEPNSNSSTASSDVTLCVVPTLIPTEVLGTHSHDELCPNFTHVPNEKSSAMSKENCLPQERLFPDLLHRMHKANSPSKPTANSQSPPHCDHRLCANSRLVSIADPQCESILRYRDDSPGSHHEPAGPISKTVTAKDALRNDSTSVPNGTHSAKLDLQPLSPPSPLSEYGPVESSLSNSASNSESSEDVPHQDPETFEDSQQSIRTCSDKDGYAERLLYSGNEIIPNGTHRLLKTVLEPCQYVTSSQNKYYSSDDSLHSPLKPCSDGKDMPAENALCNDSISSSFSEYSSTVDLSPGSGSDSTCPSTLGSLCREHELMETSGPTGNFQHGYQNRKSHRSCVSTTRRPPAHGSRRSRTRSKSPVIAVRPCKNYKRQDGGDISLVIEREKTKSPVGTEGSPHPGAKYTTAGDLRKCLVQQGNEDEEEEEEEEYNVLVDRESVSSGSLSGDVRGDGDAVRSPVSDQFSDSDSNPQWYKREADKVLGHRKAELYTDFLSESQDEYDEMDEALDYSKANQISLCSDQSEGLGKSRASYSVLRTGNNAEETDWLSYSRGGKKRVSQISVQMKKERVEGPAIRPSSIVTMLDNKGHRKTYENYPITKTVSNEHTRTVHNTGKGGGHLLGLFQKWEELHRAQSDLTQSSLNLEYLIFSEKMNQILKKNQGKANSSSSARYPWRKRTHSDRAATGGVGPMSLRFSKLEDCVSQDPRSASMALSKRRTKVAVVPEGAGLRMSEANTNLHPVGSVTPPRIKRLSNANGIAEPCPSVSKITVDSARSYQAMMSNVCSGRKRLHRPDRLKRERSSRLHTNDFCRRLKKDVYGSLHNNLNAVVRQSFKVKFRFYILATSADAFFEQTKGLLEAEGHVSVGPDQFDLEGRGSSTPLLIILRNEDIADHISTIPHLLELKKTPSVLFAGVDWPDDVLNLTHQELFGRGGFAVCDGAALDSLSLDNIKRLVRFLEELSQKGRWKWLLHYKDSRQLKENARWSSQARDLKHYVDRCKEAGLVEVMPYHECDDVSRDRPNYLHCLLCLQIQRVTTARFPVFITDSPEDSFGERGILAMNINTFLRISRTDTCTVL